MVRKTPPHRRLLVQEWFDHVPMELIATSESLGWQDVVARYLHLNPTPDFHRSPSTINDFLVLVLDGCLRMHGHRADLGFFDEKVIPGSLNLIPRDFDLDSAWDSPANAIFFELPRAMIANLAEAITRGDPEQIELFPAPNFYDPVLHQLGIALYNELQNGGPFGALYADSIARTIALHLLRHYSTATMTPLIHSGQLTAGQVRILNEYIQAHLHQKISLSDLARCVHLSVSHFERMFRATLHRPPYHYVLERRIERAKFLLREGRLPLADVGADCGFANQSQLTKHFTKFVGISPAHYQKMINI